MVTNCRASAIMRQNSSLEESWRTTSEYTHTVSAINRDDPAFDRSCVHVVAPQTLLGTREKWKVAAGMVLGQMNVSQVELGVDLHPVNLIVIPGSLHPLQSHVGALETGRISVVQHEGQGGTIVCHVMCSCALAIVSG